MKKQPGKILMVVIVVVLILGAISYLEYLSYRSRSLSEEKMVPENLAGPEATASYVCDSGLTVQAAYYQGEPQPAAAPGQPPLLGGSVKLVFSDGESMDLPQTISADGARYATADDSFVFWSKGSGALIMQNNETSQDKCLGVVADPGGLPKVYASSTAGFSLRYPADFTPKVDYKYQELGPGKDISGISFVIPATMATGTNLGADTYFSVEQLPQTADCRADLFLLPGGSGSSPVKALIDNNITYSYASSTDAGAGNRYEEMVYALPGTNPCLAVRYFIHYAAIENFPPGLVKAFDKPALLQQFDAIRHTLMIN